MFKFKSVAIAKTKKKKSNDYREIKNEKKKEERKNTKIKKNKIDDNNIAEQYRYRHN